MKDPTLLILGGYGNTGLPLARLLLQETGVRVVLAGRSRDKAEAAAAQLNSQFPGNRVAGQQADVSDVQSLKQVFQGMDMVLVASSTARYTRQAASAALETGIDYLDIQYSTQKLAVLKSLADDIAREGRCFITEGGFHPGLPSALVRFVAPHFDRLEKANVGSVIRADWASVYLAENTVDEFLQEMLDFQPLCFKGGQWKKSTMMGMGDALTMDFGGEFGRQSCMPMFLEELRSLPEMYPSLRETGFYISGFNWFTDSVALPLAMVVLKIWPQKALRPMGRLMAWSLKAYSKPPFGTLLKVEAHGAKDGRTKTMEVTLSHQDGYLFTAIPVAACLFQYLDGSIRKPGLWMQANVVEPGRFLKDMERLGIGVRIWGNGGKGQGV